MDLTVALKRVDGDWHLLGELAAMFLKDYPRMIEEVRDSIARGDHSELERAAHVLKGRLAFFGIKKARDSASRLETMGRELNLAGVREVLADMETDVEGSMLEFAMLEKGQRT